MLRLASSTETGLAELSTSRRVVLGLAGMLVAIGVVVTIIFHGGSSTNASGASGSGSQVALDRAGCAKSIAEILSSGNAQGVVVFSGAQGAGSPRVAVAKLGTLDSSGLVAACQYITGPMVSGIGASERTAVGLELSPGAINAALYGSPGATNDKLVITKLHCVKSSCSVLAHVGRVVKSGSVVRIKGRWYVSAWVTPNHWSALGG
jgi:preprotein translocase subunit SecG